MKKILVLFFFEWALFFGRNLYGQDMEQQIPKLTMSYDNALHTYFDKLGTSSILFKGKEFIEYDDRFEGHPFFYDPDWADGVLTFDGIKYDRLAMGYDLVADAIILYHAAMPYPIKLESGKISEFTLFDHRFVRIVHTEEDDTLLPTGFYDFVIDDDLSLLVRRKKIQRERIDEIKMMVENWFEEQNSYYVVRDQSYFSITSLRDLLKLVPERKKEIRRYLNRHLLRFHRQPEATLIAAVNLCNQE